MNDPCGGTPGKPGMVCAFLDARVHPAKCYCPGCPDCAPTPAWSDHSLSPGKLPGDQWVNPEAAVPSPSVDEARRALDPWVILIEGLVANFEAAVRREEREAMGADFARVYARMEQAEARVQGLEAALGAVTVGAYDLAHLVPLAASVELLHTATLVHDDVIDRSTHGGIE